MLIGTVLRPVDRHVDDLRDRLADPGEELVQVVLYPAAVEFDDRDHAAAGEAGRPVVGGAQIGDVPRTCARSGAQGSRVARELEIWPAPGDVDVGMDLSAKTVTSRVLIVLRFIHPTFPGFSIL